MIISSQRYLNDATIAEKLASRDFVVTLSPEFDFDGETYQVVIDGHHSLEAARQAGVDPEFVVADHSNDTLCLLDDGKVDDFLAVHHGGDDWYDIADGVPVW
jgi:uncharacterized Rossmann fold enzyme